MCSLMGFPEFRDQSFADQNSSMSLIKRIKPEVSVAIVWLKKS